MTVLGGLTFNTIKSDEEQVATQAIEFWSTLCDEEIDILEEVRSGLEFHPDSLRSSLTRFARRRSRTAGTPTSSPPVRA